MINIQWRIQNLHLLILSSLYLSTQITTKNENILKTVQKSKIML